MHRCQHLLVCLSRTAADSGLIRYAAMLVKSGAAVELRFVHILPSPSQGAADRDHTLLEMEQQVGEILGDDLPDIVKVYYNVLKGDLVERLLEFVAEQNVDLILVGHGRDRSGRQALARRLAMKAPCSVWMVPEGTPPRVRRILVPIDFSEHSADALSVAASLAKMVGANECWALHVYFNPAVVTFEQYDEILRGEEKEAFARFIDTLDLSGVRAHLITEEGSHVALVVHRIAAERKMDLVVMGTRGRSRSSAVLLGSEVEQAIIEARVPILAVKHYGARLNLYEALLARQGQKKGLRFG